MLGTPRALHSDAVLGVATCVILLSLGTQLARQGVAALETILSVALGVGMAATLAALGGTALGGALLDGPRLATSPLTLAVLCGLGGVVAALLFLPGLRAAKCLQDAARQADAAAASASGDAGGTLRLNAFTPSTLQRGLQHAAFLSPVLVIALWTKPLLGGPFPPAWVTESSSIDEPVWLRVRLALTICAAALQLAALRLNLQAFLSSAGTRIGEYLLSVCTAARRLFKAQNSSDGAPKLNEEGMAGVMRNLDALALRGQIGVSLAVLQLLAPPLLILALTALYVRQGGVDTGLCGGVRAALSSIGVEGGHLAAARRAASEAGASSSSSAGQVHDFIRAVGGLLSGVEGGGASDWDAVSVRAVLGPLIWVVAAAQWAAQAGALAWWEVVGPALASAAPRPRGREGVAAAVPAATAAAAVG